MDPVKTTLKVIAHVLALLNCIMLLGACGAKQKTVIEETVPQESIPLVAPSDIVEREDSAETDIYLAGSVYPTTTAELNLGLNYVRVEKLEDNMFLIMVYQKEQYKAQDIEALRIGSSIIDGKEYVINELARVSGEFPTVNITCNDTEFLLVPWADNGDYYVTDAEGNHIFTEVYRTEVVIDENVDYHSAEEYMKNPDKLMTGLDFIDEFTKNPDSFNVNKTRVQFVDSHTIELITKDA